MAHFLEEQPEWLEAKGGGLLFGLAVVCGAMVLDAIVYAMFGNTPGKALLGVSIRAADGARLKPDQYMGRNLSVFSEGLAFSIPLANLVAMASQAGRVSKGLPTTYDKRKGYVAVSSRMGILRTVFSVVAYPCLAILLMVAFSLATK